jgi:hypothetical protein
MSCSCPWGKEATCIDTSRLGEDEIRVLKAIAERLRMGALTYGRLDVATDKRDWKKEAHEEFLDATVYLAIKTLAK